MKRRTFLFSMTAAALPAGALPLRVLILTGENHYHEPRPTSLEIRRILEYFPGIEVRISEELRGATASTFAPYDVLLLNLSPQDPENSRWGIDTERAFFESARKGKGVAIYHYGLGFRPEMNDEYERLCGGTWRPGNGQHSPRHDFRVKLVAEGHPILRDCPESFPHKSDELYANLRWHPAAQVQKLATAWDDHALYQGNAKRAIPGKGLDQPVLWTSQYGAGRVFVTALGHDVEAMQDPYFRLTLRRGIQGAAHRLA